MKSAIRKPITTNFADKALKDFSIFKVMIGSLRRVKVPPLSAGLRGAFWYFVL
jgi:hypothetical protein